MSNVINRGTWDIRRHNYLVRHHVERVAGVTRTSNCEFCQPIFGCPISRASCAREVGICSQCVGAVAGSVCIT
jgi:hypothetical protein